MVVGCLVYLASMYRDVATNNLRLAATSVKGLFGRALSDFDYMWELIL